MRLEEIVASATAVLLQGAGLKHDTPLAGLGVPVYITDAAGVLVYFNHACIGFAGRTPAVGKESWCITHRRFRHDGEAQPYDEYPVAEVLRNGKPVRGAIARAERPNGSRVTFRPYPNPIFDHCGKLIGAVNVFVNLADRERVQTLRNEAARCRRLAGSIGDKQTIESLHRLGLEHEKQAEILDPFQDLK